MKRLLAALLVITMASAFTLPALAGDALAAPQSYVDNGATYRQTVKYRSPPAERTGR